MERQVLYIVVDTKGSGRLVGVFDDEQPAQRVRAIDEAYFRLHTLELNAINPVAIDWALTPQAREELRAASDF